MQKWKTYQEKGRASYLKKQTGTEPTKQIGEQNEEIIMAGISSAVCHPHHP